MPNDCKRKKITIDNENYYITVGKTFCQVTLPHENRNMITSIMETICLEISKLLELQNEEETPKDKD